MYFDPFLQIGSFVWPVLSGYTTKAKKFLLLFTALCFNYMQVKSFVTKSSLFFFRRLCANINVFVCNESYEINVLLSPFVTG